MVTYLRNVLNSSLLSLHELYFPGYQTYFINPQMDSLKMTKVVITVTTTTQYEV